MADISTAPKDGTVIRMRIFGEDVLGFWRDGGWVYAGFGGLDGELSPAPIEAITGWQPTTA